MPQILTVSAFYVPVRPFKCRINSHAAFMLTHGRSRKCIISAASPRLDLDGKSVTVVGLGVSGRAAAKLALLRGAKSVTGLDTNSTVMPLEDDPEFQDFNIRRIATQLGPQKASSFEDTDLIVLSPGVPLSHPAIQAAIKSGVEAVSELAFAAQSIPSRIPMAAISGTNGKSTVTSFTGQILQAAGLNVFIGGNLGLPLSEAALDFLSFPEDSPPYQAVVVEVSSYQMELPGQFKPKAAVILNLTPDHLERHGSLEAYAACKCHMFSQMDPSDVAIIPRDNLLLRKLASLAGGRGTRAWLGGLPGVQLDSQCRRAIVSVPTNGQEARLLLSGLKCAGSHNASHAATAALLALSLDVGVEQTHIQTAIPLLQGLPHRLEIIGVDSQSIMWINDSKATNVEATGVALKAVIGRKAVVLLGGIAKSGVSGASLGFGGLVDALSSHRAVVAFGHSSQDILKDLRSANVGIPTHQTRDMLAAMELARNLAQPGDAVLLSPGCASFDHFRNFEHRGEVFRKMSF